jgi:hypothetical protein
LGGVAAQPPQFDLRDRWARLRSRLLGLAAPPGTAPVSQPGIIQSFNVR